MQVTIIGGGLSGSEAALQLADAGVQVELYEMRPRVTTPAHKTDGLAELVCSNSLKGLAHTSAHGLLKEELRRAGSKLLRLAEEARVPAGESLAVDRDLFSGAVTRAVADHPNIRLRREEAQTLDPASITLVASGPLTSDALASALQRQTGAGHLAFFDSIAPVVDIETVDMESAFAKNRWEKGDSDDFINCPLDRDQYYAFVEALREADTVEPKPFEKGELFEGCLPVEEMARRGPETLRFGPMRPIGLRHPVTGEVPYAVVQLRAENRQRSLYNLVGFQTRLKWGTQKRIFALVPALRDAEYVRMGAMHRNTFIDSPKSLDGRLRIRGTRIHLAGQITGAEGYTEAIATGLYAASMILADMRGDTDFAWPEETCLGSLVGHLTAPNPDFQPMNFNFGLLPRPEDVRKHERKEEQIRRCLAAIDGFRPFPVTRAG